MTLISEDSNTMVQALWESSLVCLWVIGSGGIVESANPAAIAALGGESPLGRSFLQLVALGGREALEARLAQGTQDPAPFLLNLVGRASSPITLRVFLRARTGGFLVFAEHLVLADAGHQEEMAHQNREIARLHRDLARTERDLRRSNTRLEQTLTDLRTTQAMLVQSEKMAALGQVTAGVAHEVNNPLSWVISNQGTLQRAFDSLLGFVNRVGENMEQISESLPEVGDALLDAAEAADLEHLSESIPRNLHDNMEGLERVRQIVADLRTFTRLDESDLKLCDLNTDLQATLRFLSHLQSERQVRVLVRIDDIPLLPCKPGAMNQALSAVITNAIQASAPGSSVELTARSVGNAIEIVVHDHGCGIAAEHLPRIFDPFFTTKGPGGGTGLGLSVAHRVFQDHHAILDVRSQPGQGTEFKILIPIPEVV